MRRAHTLGASVALWLALAALSQAQNITKVVDHGGDGERLTIAVLGDGYDADEQKKFTEDVDRMIISGVLTQDLYKKYRTAFNVYRVNLISEESGVSTPTEHRETALKTILRSWKEGSIQQTPGEGGTVELITTAVKSINPRFVTVILNSDDPRGVRCGDILYLTRGDDWGSVAHEWGHGFADLEDEYDNPNDTYTNEEINYKNVSTETDPRRVVWKERLSNPRDPFPTTKAGEKPPKGINPDTYVGIFEGAMQYRRQIYRPFWNCRMCSNTPPFCPVCEPYMSSYLAQFLPQGGGEGDGHRDGPTREPRDVGTGAPPAADRSRRPADDQAAAPGSYVHMILQVTAQGDVEVLSAKEVRGKLVTSSTPSSDFLIVVRTNAGRVVSVQSLPGDPFGVRVFRDQKDVAKDKGKKVEHVRKTTMILQVPNYTIDRALDGRISIQIYKIKKGAPREKIGPEIFNQLMDQECLESVLMISADRLLHQLRDKGQRFR